MKKLFLLFAIFSVFMLVSCSDSRTAYDNNEQSKPEINITTQVNPSDGLDLKLVGALLQDGTCKNAEELEKELNKDGGINNLDLDGDGKIDYINVKENDSKGDKTNRSFDLMTGKEGDETHVATINVEKTGNEYNINLAGNQQIYNDNSYYSMNCGSSLGQMMFYAWLFSPRPVYYHPYYYSGYYPSYYGRTYVRPVVVSHTTYIQRTVVQRKVVEKTIKKTSTPPKSKIKSNNAGKVSKTTKTNVNNSKSQNYTTKRSVNGNSSKKYNSSSSSNRINSSSGSRIGSSSRRSSGRRK